MEQSKNTEISVAERIMKEYEIIEKVGQGANGVVWKAIHKEKYRLCAIKKCSNAFKNAAESQRIFREVEILSHMQGSENIVSFRDIYLIQPDPKEDAVKDVYMVFEYLDADLDKIIRVGILEEVNKQYIIHQILRAVSYLHMKGVIHRDIKPSNILSNKNCVIKQGDLGMARTYNKNAAGNTNDNIMTDYVATRWYRAPEILLGSDNYGTKADMWSIGCILGEMILGKVAFQGTSTLNQIERIIEVLGKPSDEDLKAIDSPMALTIMHSINHKRTIKQSNYFSQGAGATEPAMDLLSKLLEFNPNKRVTCFKKIWKLFFITIFDKN